MQLYKGTSHSSNNIYMTRKRTMHACESMHFLTTSTSISANRKLIENENFLFPSLFNYKKSLSSVSGRPTHFEINLKTNTCNIFAKMSSELLD